MLSETRKYDKVELLVIANNEVAVNRYMYLVHTARHDLGALVLEIYL